jgi:hypothetical protein
VAPGRHSQIGKLHKIELDRDAIRPTSDTLYNGPYNSDTPAEETLLYSKLYLEAVLHEFCHAFGQEHVGQVTGTFGYVRSDNGGCVADIFAEVVNEVPPSHNKVRGLNQLYTPSFSCINTVLASNTAYFASMSSAASARKVYPNLNMKYSSYDKP